MDNFKSHSRFVSTICQLGVFDDDPVTLVDVGCSGGIHRAWYNFGDRLVAYGFDGNITECERLVATERRPGVRYVPAMLGLPPDDPFLAKGGSTYWHGNPWDRLSASEAGQRMPEGERARRANNWTGDVQSEVNVILPDWLRSHGVEQVDFLKIDVDGPDLVVLTSMAESMAPLGVLAVSMEVNFFGSAAETDHTFHNTDRLLRQLGFDLFDLSVRHYSTAALPAPFVGDTAGPTRSGRVYQGDALYLLDPVRSGAVSPVALLKLCCFFELARMPDAAAEILLAFRAEVGTLVDVDAALDLLAPGRRGYREWLALFAADDPRFYNHRLVRAAVRHMPPMAQRRLRQAIGK